MAGKVVERPGQSPHLVCNNAGAVFTSAHVEAPMNEVCGVGINFQPVPEIQGTSMRHKVESAEAEMEVGKPALVVQVTGFECGGVALAVNWLHTVADGFAASQFLKAWSDACAGGRATMPAPDHGRAQVLRRENFFAEPGTFSDQELAAEHTPPGLAAVLWARDMGATAQALAATAPALHAPMVRLVHYTEAAIRKLKALTATNNGGQNLSSVTCVCAHLWQCVTRARLVILETEAQRNGKCKFGTVVDAKERRRSASDTDSTLLPASYFGNSVMSVRTREVEPEEVVRQPLGFAASLIKDSFAGIDLLRAYQYLLALGDKHGAWNITTMPPSAPHDFFTSSWYRFPLYDLHFSFPAQPVLAVCNSRPSPRRDGFAMLLPSPLGPNNLTAMLIANTSVMGNLFLDQEFVEYAY